MISYKWRRIIKRTSASAICVLLIFTIGNVLRVHFEGTSTEFSAQTGRKLLSAPWEGCSYELGHGHYAFILPYIFGVFLCFIGLALICDDFFVPSLEAISEKLDLSEDVAGATFMAAGSSAPELFISVAGVSVQSDVGIGTIVGSAMFNILIIVALCAILAGKTLYLDWRPLMRDATMYGLSIVVFIGFSWDGKLEWYEALILLLLYVLYIVLMKFNTHLMKLLLKIECAFFRHSRIAQELEGGDTQHESIEAGTATEPASHSKESVRSDHRHRFVHSHKGELAGSISHRRRSTVHSLHDHHHHHHDHHSHSNEPQSHPISTLPVIKLSSESKPSIVHELSETSQEIINIDEQQNQVTEVDQTSSSTSQTQSSVGSDEEEDPTITLIPYFPPIKAAPPSCADAKEGGALGWTKYILSLILFILSFPYLVIFTWTIPNCSKNRKWYVVTASFLMSIFWIATLSFVMVTIVARLGCLLGIGDFTMGLVVVAIGTSIPDALSSILVARDGFGDMAVSNAIGSNVFDVNLGLGLPFLIRICIDKGKHFSLLSDQQWEEFHNGEYAIIPHTKFGFILLLVVFLTLIVFTAFRFKLNSFVGLCFVAMYLLFLCYAFIQDAICEGKYC